MKRLILVGGIIFVVVALAVLTPYGWLRLRLAQSLPQITGKLELNGLAKQVDIYRDEYGIPHVFAQNRQDLFYAVGYVTAQDRLWQMDLMRRAATGRLAEIFGEQLLRTDLLMRAIGIEGVAKRQVEMLSPENASTLSAFADGVNACMGTVTLPLEFRLLKYRPEPWKPSDTLAIYRLLGWQLSKNYESEVVMMKLAAKLGPDRAAELSPTYPPEGIRIISSEEADQAATPSLEDSQTLFNIVGSSGGSNSWVLAPSRTTTHSVLLANDPHLSGTRIPSLWYYIQLEGGGFDVIGALVPGTPLPILGHNRNIGWGSTNMNADVQDIYLEHVNPQDLNQYEYDGAWVDMDTTLERIPFRMKNGKMSYIDKAIRRTIHGPIINDALPKALNLISLSWTGSKPTADFDALVALNQARNWTEFCQALKSFGVAPQNFIYGDTEGNIGYYGAGIVPVRTAGRGIFPEEGWFSTATWKGSIPFEEMPHELNPKSGFIVTANNRVIGDEYPHFLSAEWAPSYRSRRIAELIRERERHDEQSVARMQMDTKSLLAERILRKVQPALARLQEPEVHEAARLLEEWDYDTSVDSPASLIYHAFLLEFARETFVDELGKELTEEYLDQYYLWIERFVQFTEDNSRWFDDVQTRELETRDNIAVRSFRGAVASLAARYGENISDWRWGTVHTVQFSHPLDRSKLAKWLFDLGPFPFPGDGETVNRGTFEYDKPYGVSMAASIRNIMDFSHLEATSGIHTTGQSGNPSSKHYDDFAGKWLRGEYIPLWMNQADFEKNGVSYLQLVPAQVRRPNAPEVERADLNGNRADN